MIDGKICKTCNIFKPFTEYHKDNSPRLKNKFQGRCKSCMFISNRDYRDRVLSTIDGRITQLFRWIRRRADRHIVAITPADMLRQWNNQDGKCALTGLPLVTEANSPRTASLDRIDSSVGYIPTNIQWICSVVNTMKSDLDQDDFIEWSSHITDYTRSKTTLHCSAAA